MSSQEQTTRDRIRRFETDVLVHLDDLYRAALRLTGNAAEAEDLTQDTCLRAFERLDQLRSPGAARVWAFTILRSIFLRRIERQSRTTGVDIIDSSLLEAGEVLHDTYEALRPIQETRSAKCAKRSGGFRCRTVSPSCSLTSAASRTRRSPRSWRFRWAR